MESLTASSPATGTISEFASAMEQGFRSAGWKGALTKGIETLQARRKTGYSSAYGIAELYAELGEQRIRLFRFGSTPAYQERDTRSSGLKTNFSLDPCVPTHGLPIGAESRAATVAKLESPI